MDKKIQKPYQKKLSDAEIDLVIEDLASLMFDMWLDEINCDGNMNLREYE